jgi:preprotein translocase subunit SecG
MFMMVLALSAESFIMKYLAAPLFVLCCLALVLIILIQKGRGGGLSAAFGGAGAGGVLGSKTGDFLTWVTIVLVGVFLGLAILLAKYYKPPPPGVSTPTFSSSQNDPTPPSPGETAGDAGGSGEANSPGT